MVCLGRFERQHQSVTLGDPVLLPSGRLGRRVHRSDLDSEGSEIYVDCFGKLCCKHGEYAEAILGYIKARARKEDTTKTPPKKALGFTGSPAQTPCDCCNINGMRRAYRIDTCEIPRHPLRRSDLFTILGKQGAIEKKRHGRIQRLAASYPTESGERSEVWMCAKGTLRCKCGYSISFLRNNRYKARRGVKHELPTNCECPATILGRVGSLLSKHNWRGRVPKRKRLPEDSSSSEDEDDGVREEERCERCVVGTMTCQSDASSDGE